MKSKIAKSNLQDIHELSSTQAGILFHYLREVDQNLYNIQLALNIDGALNPDVLKSALMHVQSEHDALRSVFSWEDTRKPLQIILKEAVFSLEIVHLQLHEEADQTTQLEELLQADYETRFELWNTPVRFTLYCLNETSYVFAITHHHILYDGWSTGLILEQIWQTYDRLAQGASLGPATPVNYKEAWTRTAAFKNETEHEHYWRNYLSDLNEYSLVGDKFGKVEGVTKTHTFPLPIDRLAHFCAEKKVTQAAVIYGVFGLLLQKYLNQEKVVFGTTVSGRDERIRGIEKVVGNFINTVPFIASGVAEESFERFITRVNQDLLERNQHGLSAYFDIKQYLQLVADEEIFDAVVVIENYPLDDKIKGQHEGFELNLKSARENTGIPLLITVFLDKDARVELTFKEGLFPGQMVEAFSNHFTMVLEQVLQAGHQPIHSLDLLTAGDRAAIVESNTIVTYATNASTVIDLFEEQAGRNPDLSAIKSEEDNYTYAELQHLINCISQNFINQGVGKGDNVALMLEREAFMIPCIYAIMKVGACYLPVDPYSPASRINLILEDANPALLLTRAHLVREEIQTNTPTLSVEELNLDLSLTNELPELSASDNAYVIYTSGSTGKPKGVLVAHEALAQTVQTMDHHYPVNGDTYLFKTNHAFDVSLAEIFGWFHQGGQLMVLPTGQESDPNRIIGHIHQARVSHINFVPSMFSEFLGTLETDHDQVLLLEDLQYIFLAGEAVTPGLIKRYAKLGLNAKLINVYGPTEATIYSSIYPIDLQRDYSTVPIGKPLDHVQLFVLDHSGKMVPTGIPGELFIGGLGLSEGYLNNDALTTQKFVMSDLTDSGPLYQTGDLVKRNEAGEIEFLGRLDSQVKVRGFRIELGEIESHLSTNPDISNCAVLSSGSSANQELVAYYESVTPIDETGLKQFLAGRIPAYMIPHVWVHMKKLPVSQSGKINRKQLPPPTLKQVQTITVAPTNQTEKDLIDMWSNILDVAVDSIGVNSDFFMRGGHSLKAISLTNAIHKCFGVRVTVSEIFDNTTIRQQARLIDQKNKRHFFALEQSVSRTYYPLSSAQRRLYFIYEFDKKSIAYNMPKAFMMKGKLDKPRFASAVQNLVQRHEGLRTCFELINGEPMQKVLKNHQVQIESYTSKKSEAHGTIKQFIRPFTLDKCPPFRIGWIALGDDEAILLIDQHHIIGDGVSSAVLTEELMNLYHGATLPEVEFHYRDFSEWQLKALSSDHLIDQRNFWTGEFQEELDVAELPTDYNRPAIKNYEGNVLKRALSKEATNALRQFADAQGTTLFMLLLAIFKVFISKLATQKDVVVGTPVSGRSHADLERIIGMFVNMLTLKTQPTGAKSFIQYLQELKDKVLLAVENADYQFEDLIDHLGLERDTSRNPLFDVVFMFQNADEAALQLEGMDVNAYPTGHLDSKFDLTLTAIEERDNIELEFIYATDLFAEETIHRFLAYLEILIGNVVARPEQPIGKLSMLSEEERELLIHGYNDTAAPYSDHKTLVELFEEQVVKTPDHIALTDESGSITYRELNERANQLAHHLRSVGVRRNDFVCLVQARSIEMIVSVFGIVKSGGAYVGLEPALPDQRISYVLESLNIQWVLTDESNRSKVSGIVVELDFIAQILVHSSGQSNPMTDDARFIQIKDIDETLIHNPDRVNQPEDNAYAIFTSGSTGKPKGVLVKHKPVINLIEWVNQTYAIHEKDRLLFVSSISFDLSVYDMFGITARGGSLFIVPNDRVGDSNYLLSSIYNEQITFWDSAPAALNQLPHFFHAHDSKKTHDLRLVFLSGDWIPLELPTQMSDQFPGVHVVSLGGATEATIWSNYFDIDQVNPSWPSIPYGKPIQNARYYILDEFLQPCPYDVPGDLYIGGDCLATCYLNQPELSAQKFIVDPFNLGGKMYATGDLATWHRDGNMEFLGRKDFQVKVNGYRIELGEIESTLKEIQEIRDVISLVHTDASNIRSIVAYYVSDEALSQDELKHVLGEKLPAYMVPANLVHLSAMPLNANGKIDRKALPAPHQTVVVGTYVAPESPEETMLQEVWQQVLNKEKISTTANFFELGGDSIKTILVASHARKRGYHLEIRDLYQNSTIKDLAVIVAPVTEEEEVPEVSGTLPLTPIQSWFFEQVREDQHHFHQVIQLRTNAKVDRNALEKTLIQLGQYHDSLRACFRNTEKGMMAYFRSASEYEIKLTVAQVNTKEQQALKDQYSDLLSSTDLENGDLFQALLCAGDNEQVIYLMAHHLIIDNVSWNILLEDFGMLYEGHLAGEPVSLPTRTTSVANWSDVLQTRATELVNTDAQQFWSELCDESWGKIPQDKPGNKSTGTLSAEITLDDELTTALLTSVHQAYGTEMNDVLLLALQRTLEQQYGLNSLLIGLEGHGRDIYQEVNLNRTIGWFTNLYPINLTVSGNQEIGYQLRKVKETLRGYKRHAGDFGLLRYLTEAQKQMKSIPEPQIGFNYLGQLDGTDQAISALEMETEIIGLVRSERQSNLFELSLMAYVHEGKLKVELEYDRTLYEGATIERILGGYREALQAIIVHCIAQPEPVLSPSDLTFKSLSIEQLDEIQEVSSVTDILPLTPLQEGVLFHHLNDDISTAYVEQFVHEINMELDIPTFQESLIQLFERHELLRSNYLYKGDSRPMALISNEVRFELDYEDLQSHLPEKRTSIIEAFKLADRQKGFDLANDCLLRLKVFKTATECYALVWTFHHIILDAWSLDLLFADLSMIYPALLKETKLNLAKPTPFSKYINWIGEKDANEQAEYWVKYLKDYGVPTGLPVITSDKVTAYEDAEETLSFSEVTTQQVNQLTKDRQITVNTFMQCIWAIALAKYNGVEDVVFGSVVSGRSDGFDGIENMVGLLINTIPVRIKPTGDTPFIDLINQVQKEGIEGFPYHSTSLAEIQVNSELNQDLIDNILVFENAPVAGVLEEDSSDNLNLFKISNVETVEEIHYNLGLIVVPGKTLKIKAYYNQAVYSQTYIQQTLHHLQYLIEQVLSQPEVPVRSLSLVNEAEQQQLQAFGNGAAVPVTELSVIDLFEDRLSQWPNHTAVVEGDTSLSYKELNGYANIIASDLKKRGVKHQDRVALMCKPGIDLVAGMLAIVKVGGIYIPIAADTPIERLSYMLEDAESPVLVTQNEVLEERIDIRLPAALRVYELSGFREASYDDVGDPQRETSKDDLVYIIYTSGSTGKPKGVEVRERGLMNSLESYARLADLKPGVRTSQVINVAFDVTALDIWPSLTYGCSVCFAPTEARYDPYQMQNWLIREKIEVSLQVTVIAEAVMKISWDQVNDSHLRFFGYAGDQLRHYPERELPFKTVNIYGPTEDSIWSTYHEMSVANRDEIRVIGKPIDNKQLLILNKDNQCQPVGISGQLCIAGLGLAKGYLNNVERTAQSFVDHPFEKDQTMYLTGDRARWLPNGTVEFLGRFDNQVKVRGFRIELGEIETQLQALPAIEKGVVVVKEIEGDDYLTAYLVAKDSIDRTEIRKHLSKALPVYMIPSYFIQLDEIPYNANGKLDHKQLPRPEDSEKFNNYVQPEGVTQETVAAIWAEVLSCDPSVIGVENNFFELGGHSLKAMEMINRVEKALNFKISLQAFFFNPTISEIEMYYRLSVIKHKSLGLDDGLIEVQPENQLKITL